MQHHKVGYVRPEELDSLVLSTARKKIPELRQALNGKLNEHERDFLSMQLHLKIFNGSAISFY